MFEIYSFPKDYYPFWDLRARMSIGWFITFLKRRKKNCGTRILDVGSGGGWNSILAAYLGFDVSCVDISKSALQNTEQIGKRLKLKKNIDCFVSDCYLLPFADNSFDVAISSHVIEHLDKPKEMITEIDRILKVDGVLLLSCPSLNQSMRISRWFGINLDPLDHKVIGYGREQLQQLLPDNMEIRNTQFSGHFIGANCSDIIILLAKKMGITANLATVNSQEMITSDHIPFITLFFYLKEIILLPIIYLSKLEDTLSFYKGSGISVEIIKKQK